MENLILIITSIFITAFAYLLVPIIFCIRKKKRTDKQIKKIIVLNGICVWMIFAIININADVNRTSGAIFLWSAVAYFLMKKYCLRTPIEEQEQCFTSIENKKNDVEISEICLSIESEQTPINNSVPFDENKKFSADTNIDVGKIQQPETNKKSKSKSDLFSNTLFLNVVILILLLSFLGSLIANIWQYEKMEDLSYENKSLSTKLDLSKERLEECEEAELKYFKLYLQYSDKASFLTEKIAFYNEDDRYYHTFDCDSFSKTESYWAHNTEYAEWLGYEPHYCWEK